MANGHCFYSRRRTTTRRRSTRPKSIYKALGISKTAWTLLDVPTRAGFIKQRLDYAKRVASRNDMMNALMGRGTSNTAKLESAGAVPNVANYQLALQYLN